MPRRILLRDPLKAQSFKTQRADMPEDLFQPLYDRANLAAAAAAPSAQVSFFATPKGQSATLILGVAAPAAKIKSYRDTNMDNAGVNPTKMYKVIGIGFGFVHQVKQATTNPADRDLIVEGGWLSWRIIDKDILTLPLNCFPAVDQISSVTGNQMFATNHGLGKDLGMLKLPIPITLNPYENFSITFNFDGTLTLTNALDMYVYLYAYMRRPT